jgi:hypothetical protein
VYGEKAFTSNTQRALQTSPTAAADLNQIVDDRTGNLKSINLFPKSLDARGMIGVKECILKPRTFVL